MTQNGCSRCPEVERLIDALAQALSWHDRYYIHVPRDVETIGQTTVDEAVDKAIRMLENGVDLWTVADMVGRKPHLLHHQLQQRKEHEL